MTDLIGLSPKMGIVYFNEAAEDMHMHCIKNKQSRLLYSLSTIKGHGTTTSSICGLVYKIRILLQDPLQFLLMGI